MGMYYTSLELAKKQAKAVARDFKYKKVMPDVMNKIQTATTEDKIADILATCRRRVK